MSARRTPAHGTSGQLPGTLHGPAVTFKPGYKPPAHTGGFVALTEEEQLVFNKCGIISDVIDPITQEKPPSWLFKVQRPKRNEADEPVYDTRNPETTWEWVKLPESGGKMADTREEIWYEDWWALYYTYGPIPLVPTFVKDLPRLHNHPRLNSNPPAENRPLENRPAEITQGGLFGPASSASDEALAGRFWVPRPKPTSVDADLRGKVRAFFLARREDFPYDVEALIREMELYIVEDYNRFGDNNNNRLPATMVQYKLNNLTHRQARDLINFIRRGGEAIGLKNLFGLPGHPYIPRNGEMQYLRPGNQLTNPVPLSMHVEQYREWEVGWP